MLSALKMSKTTRFPFSLQNLACLSVEGSVYCFRLMWISSAVFEFDAEVSEGKVSFIIPHVNLMGFPSCSLCVKHSCKTTAT